MPASSVECSNSKDRLMLAWSILHMTQAMVRHTDIFNDVKSLDPELAADKFVRDFYDLTGKLVIPQMPDSPPPPASVSGSSKTVGDK